MLPFLKRKNASTASLIIQSRSPNEPIESEEKQEEPISAAHEACAGDLLRAIERKDIRGIAAALYDAFTIMEQEPHEEGPHVEPHSYAAQNIKAGSGEEY